MKEEGTKKTRWVCPNNCGTTAMLNAGVTLSLCHTPKCNLIHLVPFNQKISVQPRMRTSRNANSMKRFEGLFCTQCGKKATSLTLMGIQYGKRVGNGPELCYDCLPKEGKL